MDGLHPGTKALWNIHVVLGAIGAGCQLPCADNSHLHGPHVLWAKIEDDCARIATIAYHSNPINVKPRRLMPRPPALMGGCAETLPTRPG